MKTQLLSILFISSMILGCGEEEIKNVEYYTQHKDERKNKIADCNKSEEKLNSTNCANAIEAKTREHSKKMFGEGIPWTKPE